MNGSLGAVPADYVAPWWLPGGHAQTIYAATLAPRAAVAYRRERWDTPDGDFIDVDFTTSAAAADAPVLALFHGLEGSSSSPYARALMACAEQLGWRGLVAHFRGCSGEPNRLPRAYHSGDAQEIDWILRRVQRAWPAARLFAVGISLGGNALSKWLGERGSEAHFVCAAAAVGAPLDLAAGGAALGRGFNRLYTRHFLATLKRKALEKCDRFPRLLDDTRRARIARARDLHDFDDAFTAPLHGYRDADDYWSRAAARPGLRDVAVPLLVINALNDPFVPAASLPRRCEVSASVTLEYPREGGHIGFTVGPFPGNPQYLPRRIARFLAQG